MSDERLSKLLSFVLRHRPAAVGLSLDPGGWVPLDVLVAALMRHGHDATRERVLEVVRASDKQRFALDGDRIRASHGHSHPVELGYAAEPPPAVLFHGTVGRALDGIRARGLERGRRQHVHLSPSPGQAAEVARRRGAPVVLEILAAELAAAGHALRRAPNDVWLADAVPPAFIRFPD